MEFGDFIFMVKTNLYKIGEEGIIMVGKKISKNAYSKPKIVKHGDLNKITANTGPGRDDGEQGPDPS